MPHTNYYYLKLGLALGLFAVFSAASNPQAPSAVEIIKRADDAYGPAGTFSVLATVTDYQKNTKLRENVYRVYSKDKRLTLVETEKPERLSGRKLLMAGGLWLYLPTIKRPTRVSMQQRLTGEVANGDIARTYFSSDYYPKLEGLKTVDGRKCFQLKLRARTKAAPYRTVRLWVDKKTYFPVRAEYYALSGKLLKTGEFSEPEMVFGKKRVTKLTIRDGLQPQRRSVLKYSSYQKEDLDDSFFNKESLAD